MLTCAEMADRSHTSYMADGSHTHVIAGDAADVAAAAAAACFIFVFPSSGTPMLTI